MNKLFNNFYLKLLALSLAVAALGTFTFQMMHWPQPKAYYFVIGFFCAITAFIHWWLTGAIRKNTKRFPAYFMGATSIKLFASLLFIVPYSLMNPSEAKPFLLSYFLIYLIFTAFETTEILNFSNRYRKGSQPENPNKSF